MAATVSDTATDRLNAPDVPLKVTMAVPGAALKAALKVTVEALAELPGAKLAVTPEGSPVTLNTTAPAKPFCAEMAIRLVAGLPTCTVTAAGVADRAKFGVPDTVRLMLVVRVSAP